ncbi:hypothetical protein BDQ12DRAFT_593863 [Crucibulum laeve]|uniref:Uncharacterized protein n=1 Tax=Crucibulum laeve TaxID=68775 RepID=A0A5C3MGN4_9AGAR|nr:hypothetical protein BDQ12DRAFT_593863 [Crucibulum laeve]
MILLNEEDQYKEKHDAFVGPTLRHPERVLARSPSPLPDYYTSEAEHKGLIEPTHHKLSLARKFWRPTLYALGIYVLLSAVIVIPLVLLKTRSKQTQLAFDSPSSLWSVDDFSQIPVQFSNAGNLSLPKDAKCNIWSSSEDIVGTSFHIDRAYYSLSATQLLTVRSNVSVDASHSRVIHGNLSVDVNSDANVKDAVFEVSFQSTNPEHRRQTYVPSNTTSLDGDSLIFNIQLLLPRSAMSQTIPNFVTYLPMFTQTYGDLHKLKFEQITIDGSSHDITCKFLRAPQIIIRNLLAPITGNFNVTKALTLDTIKGLIHANITLAKPPDRANPTYLLLDTGYSEIHATITLSSPKQPDKLNTPSYVAQVKTFNGPIDLTVEHASWTPPMPLQLLVRNNIALSEVKMDPKFEGTFNVQSKMAEVTVQEGRDGPDPSGKNRIRTLKYDINSPIPTKATGWVGWDPNSAAQGYVEIVSSLSPVTLALGLQDDPDG